MHFLTAIPLKKNNNKSVGLVRPTLFMGKFAI